jgi:hypothetical protein
VILLLATHSKFETRFGRSAADCMSISRSGRYPPSPMRRHHPGNRPRNDAARRGVASGAGRDLGSDPDTAAPTALAHFTPSTAH